MGHDQDEPQSKEPAASEVAQAGVTAPRLGMALGTNTYVQMYVLFGLGILYQGLSTYRLFPY